MKLPPTSSISMQAASPHLGYIPKRMWLASVSFIFLAVLPRAADACIYCLVNRTNIHSNAPGVIVMTPYSHSYIPWIVEAESIYHSHSNRFDRAHEHVSGWVEQTARGLDSFLTDVITDDDKRPPTNTVAPMIGSASDPKSKGSYVTISPGVTYSDKEGVEYRGRFKARVNLPSLKNRVQIIANNVQEDEDVLTDITDPNSREGRVTGENDKSAGVGVILVDRMDFDLNATLGLRFTPEPVSKIKTKARARIRGEKTLYEFVETGFYQSDDGFGEKSEIIITHNASPRMTLRTISAALVEEETPGVTLGETLSMQYLLGPRRTVGVTFGVEWLTDPAAAVNKYALRFPYRQGIWRKWMYLRVEPGADWANEDDYKINPQITVGFDVQFGTLQDAPR